MLTFAPYLLRLVLVKLLSVTIFTTQPLSSVSSSSTVAARATKTTLRQWKNVKPNATVRDLSIGYLSLGIRD